MDAIEHRFECDGGYACMAEQHIEGCHTGENDPTALKGRYVGALRQQHRGAVSVERERWVRWASAHRCCDAGLRAAPDPCPWHDDPTTRGQ